MSNNSKKQKSVKLQPKLSKDPYYLYRASNALSWGKSSALYAIIPVILFSAVTIIIVRLHIYSRPMSQFYWTSESDSSQLSDFFSYNKMIFIVVAAVLALVVLLFLLVSQSIAIKRTKIYIPMVIYILFVLISYFLSEYKEFSLLGYNDRFEGTIPLVCYMVMLFFVINTINSELNLKQIIWPLAITSILLSILGISQALDHDFFRTLIGQKLISPNYQLGNGGTLWQAIEDAFNNGQLYYNFTFKNREIYQTVYNINYVSFYLTLLLPLFGMLFIRTFNKEAQEPLWKKIGLGILLILILFNFIGSKSSGGFLGLGVIGILGIAILNKQLLKLWKPILAILIIIVMVMGITTSRWIPELAGAFKGLSAQNVPSSNNTAEQAQPASIKPTIDYIRTGDYVEFSINGNRLLVDYRNDGVSFTLNVYDENMNTLKLTSLGDGFYSIDDERFYSFVKIGIVSDSEQNLYLDIYTPSATDWLFVNVDGHIYYSNALGYSIDLGEVEHIGFENHYNFGSKRGYIWATSLPILKHTLVRGYGADTFCLYYPQNDYAGKYNAGYNVNIIVDKPHNMYLHAAIGTGCISAVALIVLYGMYVVQSIKLFWKRDLGNNYLLFAGFGLFCGLTAFMVTGLVDDSTVSVMPMFYTLLGCGVAVNMMIMHNDIVHEQ